MTTLLAPGTVLIAIAILVFRQIAKLHRRTSIPQPWIPDIGADRYRPMFRLLDEEEVRFVGSQPGATPDMLKRLRRQRCEIFRGYLRSLEYDFQMASDALVQVMLQSQYDRRDIVRALVGSRLSFTAGVFRVRCRLLLYRWSVGPESIARLVGLFEGLQLELLALSPAPDRAGV